MRLMKLNQVQHTWSCWVNVNNVLSHSQDIRRILNKWVTENKELIKTKSDDLERRSREILELIASAQPSKNLEKPSKKAGNVQGEVEKGINKKRAPTASAQGN